MKDKIIRFAGIVLFIVFVLCIVMGQALGEADIVFQKASQICMECIGIG